MIYGIQKNYNFDPYKNSDLNFVVQGHIYISIYYFMQKYLKMLFINTTNTLFL